MKMDDLRFYVLADVEWRSVMHEQVERRIRVSGKSLKERIDFDKKPALFPARYQRHTRTKGLKQQDHGVVPTCDSLAMSGIESR